MEISVENILKNREIIRQIWIDNFTKQIDIIEYRSCHEGLGSLYLFIGYKNLFSDFFITFMTIWVKTMYFHEQWMDLTINDEDANAIIDNWLISKAAKWKVAELTSSQLISEFSWRSQEIKSSIERMKRGTNSVYLPGIYINHVAIDIENKKEFNPPVLLDPYQSGIILEDEWNQVTYFLETASGFVYYSA